MRAWLLDTGPLVAYLDASDKSHQAAANCLDRFTGQLFTTSAVITEAMHFLAAAPRGAALLAEFVGQSELQVVDFSGAEELAEAARRMEKYANLPMDYADATLVLLAERLNVFDLVTLDRRGFSAFRSSGGKHFSLVLDQTEPEN
ncbi:MAG TPA: PIN domain-containing protein [Thermoanaerobaculia bacterium]|nr:PIN domain-containing protein [Thermoanaerobaculia bacterium]